MNTRSMKTLIVIAVFLVVGVVALDIASDRYRTADGAELLPGFEQRINGVASIAVHYPGAEVTIANMDGAWVVREKDDYPADTGTLRQVLIALKDATKLEQKTASPALHEKLGLSTTGDGEGVSLTIGGEGFEHALIIGNVAQQKYRYVRFADEDQSWLIDRNPQLPDDASGWLAPDILDLPSSRIRSVSIVHADGERIEFSKSSADDSTYAVADVPEGRELSYPGVVNGIAGALQNLDLEDVRRRSDDFPEAETTTTWTTFDGLQVVAERYVIDDEAWFAFSAAALAPEEAADSPDAADESATEADPTDDAAEDETDAAAKDAETVAAEAESINADLSAWIYRLPEPKERLTARRWTDLLKTPATDSDE